MSHQWEAHRFVEELENPSASGQNLNAAAAELFNQLDGATDQETAAVMGTVAEAIRTLPPQRALLAGMVCGAMVERGADATPMVEPLMARLRQIVPKAAAFLQAVKAIMPKEPDDADAAFQEAGAKVSQQMPGEASDWILLGKIFPPVIAMTSVSPAARAAGQDLLPQLRTMVDWNDGANWIRQMLRVLHDEPFVAIEVASRRGIVGRMSGVSINFQLHMLLMDVFPRSAGEPPRLPPEVVDVVRGDGPQQLDYTVQGTWNPYAYTALQPDLTLPEASDYGSQEHWIWNEGVPQDIPVFDGARVILLGPAAYVRTWRAQRDFTRLRAELAVDKVLSPAEAEAMLRKIAGASADQ